MAKGQLTFLRLTNSLLRRLGKTQVTTLTGISTDTDSWTSIAMDMLNEAQTEVYKEHDWSTLITSGTFTTSSRTYNLSTSFSGFDRLVAKSGLTDTTNLIQLFPANSIADFDAVDPAQTTAGVPYLFYIDYPNLLFNYTPTAITYRIRYLTRPAVLSGNSAVSDLPEHCDLVLVMWAYWQLMATREDAADGGQFARTNYTQALLRAIGQDQRRVDRVYRLDSVFPTRYQLAGPSWPPSYDRSVAGA